MKCPKCGSEMERVTEEVTVESGELWWENEVLVCPDCGHEENAKPLGVSRVVMDGEKR